MDATLLNHSLIEAFYSQIYWYWKLPCFVIMHYYLPKYTTLISILVNDLSWYSEKRSRILSYWCREKLKAPGVPGGSEGKLLIALVDKAFHPLPATLSRKELTNKTTCATEGRAFIMKQLVQQTGYKTLCNDRGVTEWK